MRLTKWHRVSRRHKCPICDRRDWCLTTGPIDAPTAVICARVESAKQCGDAGWLHQLRHNAWQGQRARSIPLRATSRVLVDLPRFVAECREALDDHCRELLSKKLGVGADILTRLDVGWSNKDNAYTFPMTDANRIVRGIRLRDAAGRKWAVRGGREGLFVPHGLKADHLLLVCEGPTDTSALLDLGFDVVGRPNCSGGMSLVVDLVIARAPVEVAIIADDDLPGQLGANNLATVLRTYCPLVRVIFPPAGIKDARQWKQRGATRADVLARIARGETIDLTLAIRRPKR